MGKKQAIKFLKIKLNEIPHLLKLPYDNVEYPIWRDEIEDVLEEVFGRESKEYRKFYEAHRPFKYDPPRNDYYKLLIKRKTIIKSIINKYEILGIEQEPAGKTETKDSVKSPLEIFDALQLHPRIIKASKSLFHSGHHAEAIFAAFKALNNFTKIKAAKSLDGKDLMAQVFNEDNPIIKINKLMTRSERDEQEGFRFLFMGAMVGIRNPKAHDDIRQIDPYKALEYLAFASLLMRRATEGKLEPKNK